MFCISHTILPHKSKAASSFSTLAASSVSCHLNSSEGKSTAIRAVFHPNFIDQKLLIAPGGGRGGGGAKKNLVPKNRVWPVVVHAQPSQDIGTWISVSFMFCISHTILPHKSKAASSFSTLAASSVSYHLNSSEGKSTAIRAVFHPNFIDQKLLIAHPTMSEEAELKAKIEEEHQLSQKLWGRVGWGLSPTMILTILLPLIHIKWWCGKTRRCPLVHHVLQILDQCMF